jgi:murein DD-endopeptidase MepM/ murein hydrolase activator NlpD
MKLYTALLGFLLSGLGAQQLGAETSFRVVPQSAEIFQGEVLRAVVSGQDAAEIIGVAGTKAIPFFPVQDGVHVGFIGVDLEQKPGPLKVEIRSLKASGESEQAVLDWRVKQKRFAEERFSVSPSFDRFDETTRKRIENEQKRLDSLWKSITPARLWSEPFELPVKGAIGSPFGLRRVINGLARAPHTGVDIKAPSGTEIVASNEGKVVIRDEFYFGGKTVVLDHGGGLYTMYLHLNDFRVTDGVTVRKGELIGWVGMTGRVTGPHLHWAVRLLGARVDPLELVKATGTAP